MFWSYVYMLDFCCTVFPVKSFRDSFSRGWESTFDSRNMTSLRFISWFISLGIQSPNVKVWGVQSPQHSIWVPLPFPEGDWILRVYASCEKFCFQATFIIQSAIKSHIFGTKHTVRIWSWLQYTREHQLFYLAPECNYPAWKLPYNVYKAGSGSSYKLDL